MNRKKRGNRQPCAVTRQTGIRQFMNKLSLFVNKLTNAAFALRRPRRPRLALPDDDDKRVMPLPRYEGTMMISRGYLRMTAMIPRGVQIHTDNPLNNIALGIQHLLAVYAGKKYRKTEILNALVKNMDLDHIPASREDIMRHLTQGRHELKVISGPSYVKHIVSKTLRHFSSLFLETEYQTSSWNRILAPDVTTGTYAIFFIVEPVEGEDMFTHERHRHGEYIQMAICDTKSRLLCPCNKHGSAYIMGKDLEALCEPGLGPSEIVDHLNSIVCGPTKGIYPQKGYGNRNVRLGGIYELKQGDIQQLKPFGVPGAGGNGATIARKPRFWERILFNSVLFSSPLKMKNSRSK